MHSGKIIGRIFCKKQRESQSGYARAALNMKHIVIITVINKTIIKSDRHFDHRHHLLRALSKSQDCVGQSSVRQTSYWFLSKLSYFGISIFFPYRINLTSSGHLSQNSWGSLPCLRSLIFVTRSISVPNAQSNSNKMIPKLKISA